MDFSEYQRRAAETDVVEGGSEQALIVPLLGLAGEVGSLLAEYKKRLRDGESHTDFKARVAEDIGDLLWYSSNVASKFDLNLEDIAEQNLKKTFERWGTQLPARQRPYRLFDDHYPDHEQLPRRFLVKFAETTEPQGRVRVRTAIDGEQVGDEITDNAYVDDGYRFHDVLHLSNVAILGWSPTMRALLKRKRKSNPTADEVEDGGRAIVIDEALCSIVFEYARRHNFLDGITRIDDSLLRSIKVMTDSLEVRERTPHDWEQAVLSGFEAWRHIRKNHGGLLEADMTGRELRIL